MKDLVATPTRLGGRRCTSQSTTPSRLAYVEVLPNQIAKVTIGFLARAISWSASHGVIVKELLTDNGSAYISDLWAQECAQRGLVHIKTRPYRPRTNGKACEYQPRRRSGSGLTPAKV